MKILVKEKPKLKAIWNIKKYTDGKLVQEIEKENLIVNTGKNVLARLLGGDTTYTGEITRCAVGTGTSSPAVTDTTLQTELERNAYNDRSRINNVLTLEYFFGITEANGILKEAGLFIDGTDTVDSGQLFNRVNIDVTKTSNDSLVITVQITVG